MSSSEFSMEDKTPAENVKISIDKILNSKTSLRKKPKTVEDVRKQFFKDFITGMELVSNRSILMVEELGLNYEEYDSLFLEAIDNLLALQFNERQISLIQFYVYDRVTPEGEVLSMEGSDGSSILLEHPDHLWEFLKGVK